MIANYKAEARSIEHVVKDSWNIYNVTLTAVYDWDNVLQMAQELIDGDVNGLGSVTISERATTPEIECIQNFDPDTLVLKDEPLFANEYGLFSVAGFSADLETPIKITWYSTTPLLRIYTLAKFSEERIKEYVSEI